MEWDTQIVITLVDCFVLIETNHKFPPNDQEDMTSATLTERGGHEPNIQNSCRMAMDRGQVQSSRGGLCCCAGYPHGNSRQHCSYVVMKPLY